MTKLSHLRFQGTEKKLDMVYMGLEKTSTKRNKSCLPGPVPSANWPAYSVLPPIRLTQAAYFLGSTEALTPFHIIIPSNSLKNGGLLSANKWESIAKSASSA